MRENLRLYRQSAAHGNPRLVLIRFYHVAASHEQAQEEAKELLQPFIDRMQGATAAMLPEWTTWFKLEQMIAESLIGTALEICDRIKRIEAELAPYSLILKPISPSFAKRRADLELFAAKIRPLYAAPLSKGGEPQFKR